MSSDPQPDTQTRRVCVRCVLGVCVCAYVCVRMCVFVFKCV